MSYLNHIIFTFFTAALCVSPLNAQTTNSTATQNQDGIEFYYFPNGNDNTTCDFEISFAVNDSQIKDAYFSMFTDLKAVIEYQSASQKSTTSFTPIMSPKALKNVGEYFFGEIKLEGLQSNTPYRARLRFFAPQTNGKFVQVGHTSSWYYTTTLGDTTQSKAQAKRTLQTIHNKHALNTSVIKEDASLTHDQLFCFDANDANCEQVKSAAILAPINEPVLIARKTQATLIITQ